MLASVTRTVMIPPRRAACSGSAFVGPPAATTRFGIFLNWSRLSPMTRRLML